MRLGPDFSEWGGPLEPATVVCWKANGADFAVVQYSQRARQHLATLQGQMQAEMYVYLYWLTDPWGQTPAVRTQNALNICAAFGVKRLWLDCEDSMHPFNPKQLDECINLCHQAGVEAGIYTGRWWWEPQTDNSSAYAHLPLWHAEYVDAPPDDFTGFKAYGGWSQPLIWQWKGTTSFCGHSVDLNVMEDGMSESDKTELSERRAKMALLGTLLADYRVVEEAPNTYGQRVVSLRNQDGSATDPPVVVAIRS